MIMSVGMTSVLLFGSIDLSMGAVCSVSNVMFVKFLKMFSDACAANGQQPNVALATFLAFLISLAFGLGAGFMLGVIHVKLKVPSFIASLAFMSMWQSAALLIAEAPISAPKSMWGAVNWVKVSFAWWACRWCWRWRRWRWCTSSRPATPPGAPCTPSAATNAPPASRGACGPNEDRGVHHERRVRGAGGVFPRKLRSCAPTIGDPFTLLIVASCVLRASLTGGKGSALGTVLGVFTVAIINNA
jgi:ribose transport system permease protein